MARQTDKKLREVIGKNIKYLRKMADMNQADLARKMGWMSDDLPGKGNLSMVSQIERGHVGVSIETLNKLSEILRVEIADFFRENIEEIYPNIVFITQTKQEELLNPGEAKSKLPQLEIAKRKTIKFTDIMDVIDPLDENGKSIPPSSMFRLPDWLSYRNKNKLVCAVINIKNLAHDFDIGDIICVDYNDVPSIIDNDEIGYFVLETSKGPKIIKGEKKGNILILHLKGLPKDQPYLLDLRLHKKLLIGRVLWQFRTV